MSRKAWIIPVALFCSTALLPAGLYFFLKSPAVMSRLIPEISSIIKEATGADVTCQKVSVDLPGNVLIQGFSLKFNQRGLKVAAKAGSLEVRFSVRNLLDRVIFLEHIRITEPTLNVTGTLLQDKHESQSSAGKNTGLAQFLRNPPAEIVIHQLSMENAEIDADIANNMQTLRLVTGPFTVQSSAEVRAGHVRLKLNSTVISDKNHLRTGDHSFHFASKFTWTGGGSLEARLLPDQTWRFFVDQFRSESGFSETRGEFFAPDKKYRLKVQNTKHIVNLQGECSGPGESDDFFRSPEFSLNLNVQNRLKTEGLSAQAVLGNTTWDLSASPRVDFGFQAGYNPDKKLTGSWSEAGLSGESGQLTLSSSGRISQNFAIKNANVAVRGSADGESLSTTANLGLSELAHPEILAPVSAKIMTNLTGSPFRPFKAGLTAYTEGNKIISINAEQKDAPDGQWKIEGGYHITLTDALSKFHPGLSELFTRLGPTLKAESTFEAALFAKKKDKPARKEQSADGISGAEILLTQHLTLPVSRHKGQIVNFPELTASSRLTWSPDAATVENHIKSPQINLPQLASLKDHTSRISITAVPGIRPQDISVSLQSKVKKMTLEHHSIPANLGKDLALHADLHLRDFKTFQINKLGIWSGPGKVLSLKTQASGSLESGNALSQGECVLLKEIEEDRIKTSGETHVTWSASVFGKKDVTMNPSVNFRDFSFSSGNFRATNIQGGVRFFESFRIENAGKLKPTHLIHTDPFRRVDIKGVDPFLETQHKLTIDSLAWKKWVVGPLQASASVEQNTLNLPVFNLKLFGGHLAGECYLDFHPQRMLISLKGMLSDLDPFMISHPDKNVSSPVKDRVDANISVQADLKNMTVEGQVNITKIGRTQFLEFIRVLDPEYEDEQMAGLRSALGFSAPTGITVTFYQGFMDMTVHLDGLAKKAEVKEFPVSAFLNRYGEEIRNLTKHIPLS